MTCSVVRYELQDSPRDLATFDALGAELAIFPSPPRPIAPRTPRCELAAVVHRDAHLDRLATVLPFASIWLVSPAELTR